MNVALRLKKQAHGGFSTESVSYCGKDGQYFEKKNNYFLMELTEAQLYNLNSSGSSMNEVKAVMMAMMIQHLYEVHKMGVREIHRQMNVPMKEVKKILNLTK